MIACLILLGALLIVGLALWLTHKPDVTDQTPEHEIPKEIPEECCGTHAVCEKINAMRLAPVEYYDDEELDAFKGRNPESYTDDEIEAFRDILLSLLPTDVAGWGTSLEKRGIRLPIALRDEYILLMNNQ